MIDWLKWVAYLLLAIYVFDLAFVAMYLFCAKEYLWAAVYIPVVIFLTWWGMSSTRHRYEEE